MARFDDEREQTSAPLSDLAQALYRRTNLPLIGKAARGEGWTPPRRDAQSAVFDAMGMSAAPLSFSSRINLLRVSAGAAPGGGAPRMPAPSRLPAPTAAERMADLERVPRLPPQPDAAMLSAAEQRVPAAGGRRLERPGGDSKIPIGSKPFDEQRYSTPLGVRVEWPGGVSHVDEVKGLNPGHALARAAANWPDAERIGMAPVALGQLDAPLEEEMLAAASRRAAKR